MAGQRPMTEADSQTHRLQTVTQELVAQRSRDHRGFSLVVTVGAPGQRRWGAEMVTARSMGRRQQPSLQSLVHGGNGDREGREVPTEPVCRMIWGSVHGYVVRATAQ